MKTAKNKKTSEPSSKKVWKKPVVKEEQSLLVTKTGDYTGEDGSGKGDYIGAS